MVAEVVVPGSALLVPGVAGRSDPLDDDRARVVAELGRALHADVPARRAVERVEVRPAAHAAAAARGARLVPDLGALGIDARWSGWSFTGNDDASQGRAGVAATVALLALGGAGWNGPVDVVEASGVEAAGPDARDGDVVVVVVVRRPAP